MSSKRARRLTRRAKSPASAFLHEPVPAAEPPGLADARRTPRCVDAIRIGIRRVGVAIRPMPRVAQANSRRAKRCQGTFDGMDPLHDPVLSPL